MLLHIFFKYFTWQSYCEFFQLRCWPLNVLYNISPFIALFVRPSPIIHCYYYVYFYNMQCLYVTCLLPVAILAKTLWGAGPPSAEWGAISNRWKKLEGGGWTKSGGWGLPGPGLEPPLFITYLLPVWCNRMYILLCGMLTFRLLSAVGRA